jgi:hypothetical protein
MTGLPAFDHKILRDHLDEIDRDVGLEEFSIVFFAQAEAITGKEWNGSGHSVYSAR